MNAAVHDFSVERFDWNLSAKTLTLSLILTESDQNHRKQIFFSGVVGWHIDDAVDGCILFDIKKIDGALYLEADKTYIASKTTQCYPVVVDKIESGDVCVWVLSSSYGMSGYIVAKAMHECT